MCFEVQEEVKNFNEKKRKKEKNENENENEKEYEQKEQRVNHGLKHCTVQHDMLDEETNQQRGATK